jgi:hypothetical protein
VKHSLFVVCMGIAALVGGVAPSQAADLAAEVLKRAAEHCRSINDGEFHADEGAITQLDLTGDGAPEQVVDANHFSCSTAVTPYCGSGGCPLTVIVEGKPVEFQALRWKVIHWDDQPVLLLHVYSAACESADWQPCIKALVWSNGSFRSVVSRP